MTLIGIGEAAECLYDNEKTGKVIVIDGIMRKSRRYNAALTMRQSCGTYSRPRQAADSETSPKATAAGRHGGRTVPKSVCARELAGHLLTKQHEIEFETKNRRLLAKPWTGANGVAEP